MKNLNDKDRKELARKYGRVIKTVDIYKLGVCADVFLQKDGMQFSAHLNGQYKASHDGKEVEKWLLAQLKAVATLEWVPVICVLDAETGSVNWSGRELELHQIAIDVHRFFVAALPDGSVRAVEWDVPENNRLMSQKVPYNWIRNGAIDNVVDGGKIVLPLHNESSHILPYSEKLWHGLNELMRGIDSLRTKLHVLLNDDAGLLRLENIGARIMNLLEAPDENTLTIIRRKD